MPFSKLPTNHVILQRILFEIENNHGAASFQQASLNVTNEVLAVWEYAGYGDILHNKTYILKNVKALQIGYKSLIQVPVKRRGGPSCKEELKKHEDSLPLLFDISVKYLQSADL